MLRPSGSDSEIHRSTFSSAARSPSIAISIWMSRTVRPKSSPAGSPCSSTWNLYLPSAGKICVTTVPPRVPNGAPSTRPFCDCVLGTSYCVEAGSNDGSPTATRLTYSAARKYPCITVADGVCTSAMLSKPALIVSAGR